MEAVIVKDRRDMECKILNAINEFEERYPYIAIENIYFQRGDENTSRPPSEWHSNPIISTEIKLK